MRRILSIIAIALFTFTVGAFAQQNNHFQFKGIPIDGSLTNFGRELAKQGFVEVANNTYKGKFLRNEAIVALVGDDDNMIWRVAAIMPSTDTWSILESSYNGYVELYTQKYGKPSKSGKNFLDYTGNGSALKMIAIDKGECNYYAIWNLPQGSIEVRIVKGSKYLEGTVRIIYTDKANKEDVRKSDLSEI